MDELSKSTQESKPRSGQRGRKRAAATSESDDQQWPDKRLKEDLEFEDEQNSPPKKGRRGRPPKSAKASAAKEEPVAKTPKRGRKKAVAVEIPQDDEEESLDIADEQDYENVEQKRRGKAPGRASRKTAQKSDQPDSVLEPSQATPQKRRGRPPKSASTQQKKSPGRPKKAATKEPESDDEMDVSHNSPALSDNMSREEEEEEEEEVTPVPVRRRATKKR